jgi:hypothetical protein
MFELTKIQQIVDHLHSISKLYKDQAGEIVIHCPFCDDASRKNALSHGHCYLSKTHPVFHCFRCDSSGTLLRLLIETGFDDSEILSYLNQSLSYKFTKNYYQQSKKRVIKLNQIYNDIIKQNIEFQLNNEKQFEVYKQYLKSRLGDVDFSKFLITPDLFHNKLCCNFINSDNILVVQRIIDNTDQFRYHLNKQSNGLYYFQEKNFEIFNRIVLAEGPFDIIPLYLYNYNFKDCFFMSISGKKYISVLENLLIQDLLIGNFQINLIFDKDVDYKKYMYRSKSIVTLYNSDIELKGHLPLIKKDTGEFPATIEI